MKLQKLGTCHYIHKQTGFEFIKDDSLEGQLVWAIIHKDDEKINEYLYEGNDQLWATLWEAKMAIKDYLTQ